VLKVLAEYKIHHCELLFREDASVDQLIDALEGNRKYIKCLYVYNKVGGRGGVYVHRTECVQTRRCRVHGTLPCSMYVSDSAVRGKGYGGGAVDVRWWVVNPQL
jgi:hypothetical protein